ncbi:exported hypothetical protein [uncultured Sporomusa sp.]|uniref:Uncharacterized protein n=1 Tax=uncultured Sporomusa sp. TaxID=307249 RepID=A0A212LWT6_9FIRM|nr:hypothetical protein [uncultured Sporomusa sp.]SCM81988.1 exported hypothetical protein [uncultured Sporomusa sp.]
MRRLVMILMLTLVWPFGVNLPPVQASEEGAFPPVAIGKGAPTVSIVISADRIAVYQEGKTQSLLQEIPYNAAILPELADSERVVAEDMNFDGYLDFKIASSQGSANAYYSCWLWDPKSGNFVLHEELSRLVSPAFNPDVKTVYSFTHISAADSEEATYVWKDGRLWPVQIIERSYDPDEDRLIAREYRLDEQGKRQLVREQKLLTEEAMRNEYEDLSEFPFPDATPYKSPQGFSLLLPVGAAAKDTADGVKVTARKWFVLVNQLGREVQDLDNSAVREALEAKVLLQEPFSNSQIEWAYQTDTIRMNGYEFYRRPFTGTIDGQAIRGGELYYANIYGRHFQVICVKMPGISDGIILLYKMLYHMLVIEP